MMFCKIFQKFLTPLIDARLTGGKRGRRIVDSSIYEADCEAAAAVVRDKRTKINTKKLRVQHQYAKKMA